MNSIHVGGLAPWQKRRVIAVVDQQLDAPLRVSDLAKECGLSASHFARSFTTTFGVSTHRWLVRRRIELSQQLLIATREPLACIAHRVGFADQAAFTRTFHKIAGVSPGRWRRFQRVARRDHLDASTDKSGAIAQDEAGRASLTSERFSVVGSADL